MAKNSKNTKDPRRPKGKPANAWESFLAALNTPAPPGYGATYPTTGQPSPNAAEPWQPVREWWNSASQGQQAGGYGVAAGGNQPTPYYPAAGYMAPAPAYTGGMPINTIQSVYGTPTLPESAVPGYMPIGSSNYLANPLIYQTYGMAPATAPTNAPPVYIGAAGVGPAPGQGMTSQQQQEQQQQQQAGGWYQYGDRFYTPETGVYGYVGLDNNIMNSEGRKIGHIGASGLGWYSTRRGQGKNYRWMMQNAQSQGPEAVAALKRKLQARRDIMKYRGIGAGRPPETKGRIPMPGGNGRAGGGGGQQQPSNAQASPYNELINWQI